MRLEEERKIVKRRRLKYLGLFFSGSRVVVVGGGGGGGSESGNKTAILSKEQETNVFVPPKGCKYSKRQIQRWHGYLNDIEISTIRSVYEKKKIGEEIVLVLSWDGKGTSKSEV